MPQRMVLEEMRPAARVSVTAGALLERIQVARTFLTAAGVRKGHRCALLAPNSIQWVALDLAAMADGLLVVPLYSRQAPAELAAVLRDPQPGGSCCGDAASQEALRAAWPGAPRTGLPEQIVAARRGPSAANC